MLGAPPHTLNHPVWSTFLTWLSETALTAGVVEHHDVIHGDVTPPLPGDGRLDQHLQRRSGRKGAVRNKKVNI